MKNVGAKKLLHFFIDLFISFILLSDYSVPGTVLDAGDRREMCLPSESYSWGDDNGT